MLPTTVRNSDLLLILYSKPLRELRKAIFNFGHIARTSKCDLPFWKGHGPQFTQEIVANYARKPPSYTIKHEQNEIIPGKLYQKGLMKVN